MLLSTYSHIITYSPIMGVFFFYFEIFNFIFMRESSSLSLNTKTSFISSHTNFINKRFYVKSATNNSPELEPLLKDILVGVILGDGWIEKPKVNARFRFEQSDLRRNFFFHLYQFFAVYCHSAPKLRNRQDKRTKKNLRDLTFFY